MNNALRITSRKNPLAAHLKKLGASREYRAVSGEFLCDGKKLLQDAINAGAEITAVLTASAELAVPDGVSIYRAERELIDSLSPLKNAQDTLFACKLRSYTFNGAQGVSILLDGVQDPGNIGTVIRTANALGVKNVILTGGCADPYNPKTVRATMGAVFRQCFIELTYDEVAALIGDGRRMIGAALGDGCRELREANLKDAVIAIGSEGRGLSEEMLSLCRERITIPIAHECESLNAAVAAAIIMWEASYFSFEKEK